MKIIAIDNFGRDNVADILIAENVNTNYVDIIVDELNNEYCFENSILHFIKVEDDYVLSRGMADIVGE